MTAHRRQPRLKVKYQFQTTECGVAALGMMLAYHGRHVALEEIREATSVSRDCMNASDMVVGARHFGLECKVRKCEPENLTGLGLPLIVYMNFIHFMVLEDVTETHIRLVDPHGGRTELSHAQFNEQFTGIVLTFKPSASFEPNGMFCRAPWLLRHIGWRGATQISMAVLSSVFSAGAVVAASVAVTVSDVAMLWVALAVLAVSVFLSRVALTVLKQNLIQNLSKAAIGHIRIMKPAFFAYRIPNRLNEVVHSVEAIGNRFCDDILPAWLGVVGLPVLLGGLWAVHAPAGVALTSVAAVFGLFWALLTWSPWMRYVQPRSTSSDAFGGMFGALERIETWKTGGRVRDFLLDTLDTHAVEQARTLKTRGHEIAVSVCRTLALPVAIAAALFSVVPAFQSGELDAPGTLAVVLLSAVIAPAISKGFTPAGFARILQKDLFHLEDAMTAVAGDETVDVSADKSLQLSPGMLAEMSDIYFGHSRQRQPILEGVSLSVRHGEQLGITGPSGGGKSTIARLIAGVERPWAGEVRIDGSSTPPTVRAWLDKSPTFFEASLRDNLTLWQDDISDAQIWSVLDAVYIGDLVRERDGGLDAPTSRMGGNFSGGQLQRLEIARALLSGANFLIIDEALDALNPVLETKVRAMLRERGCTLVVVSHRHSTLAECERVLRVVDGRIVDAADGHDEARPGLVVQQTSAMGEVFNADVVFDANDGTHRWPVDAELRSTFGYLAKHFGTCMVKAEVATTAMSMDEAAAAYGFDLRPLRVINPQWWHLDGALGLVRERDSGHMQVVMPDASGPVLYDPTTDTHRPFPKDPESIFEREAFRLYLRHDQHERNPLKLITRSLSSVRGDVIRFAAAVIAIGSLSAAWPLVLSSASEGAAFVLGAGALIASLVLLEVACALHERRAHNLVEHGVLHALAQRCGVISVPFIRASKREDIAAAVHALPRINDIVRKTPLRHLTDAVTSVGLLGFLLFVGTARDAGLPLVLIMMGLGFSVAIANLRLPHLDRSRRGRSASRRFLFTALDGIFRIKALSADQRILSEWLDRFRAALSPMQQAARLQAVLDVVLTVLPWGGVVGFVAWQGGAVQPAIGFAVWLAIASGCEFSRAFGNWLDVRADIGRMALLTQAPLEPMADTDVFRPDALSLHEIDAGYQGARVLSDVSLSVQPGEIIAVAGASGSGKSTLIDVLLGFHDIDDGIIRVDGEDFHTCNVPGWRNKVASILQRDRLDVAMTVRGQIAGRAPIGLREIWHLLQDVELDEEVAAMPMATQSIVDDFRLSTGQRQRLLLARALARAPRLLFLDEALSAVPDDMKERLIKMIRDKGIAAVIVTHDEHLIGLADRVCVLDQGDVAYDGAPIHVLDDPTFLKLFETEKREE